MRREPQQERAKRTVARILRAAETLYNDSEVGRDRLETAQVAAAAGVAIGTLYRYFDDRVDLMDAVAPDRDLPDEQLLLRAERYVQRHGALPPGGLREVVTFLMEATP